MMDRRGILMGLLGVAGMAGLTGVVALWGTPERRSTNGAGTSDDGPWAQVILSVEGMT